MFLLGNLRYETNYLKIDIVNGWFHLLIKNKELPIFYRHTVIKSHLVHQKLETRTLFLLMPRHRLLKVRINTVHSVKPWIGICNQLPLAINEFIWQLSK